MRNPLLAVAVAACLSAFAAGQTVTAYFPDNLTTGGSQNAFPFNTQIALGSAGYTTLNVYPAAVLVAAMTVRRVRVDFFTVITWSWVEP